MFLSLAASALPSSSIVGRGASGVCSIPRYPIFDCPLCYLQLGVMIVHRDLRCNFQSYKAGKMMMRSIKTWDYEVMQPFLPIPCRG